MVSTELPDAPSTDKRKVIFSLQQEHNQEGGGLNHLLLGNIALMRTVSA
jgi:hypothetical protein